MRPATFATFSTAKLCELEWLKTVMKSFTEEIEWVSWSAYHANVQEAVMPPAAISALLPLFIDNAHSVAMIKHSMTMVQAAVQHLNPGQVPVITADQPLFALAKQIQWTWPSTLGENHFVVMFGGLHTCIEMAILKVLGDWLDGSGWIGALVQANIASSGTADSFIKVNHVTKTRHAHQVTAASINILLHRAYFEYRSKLEHATPPETNILSLDEWCKIQRQKHIQFEFWLKTLSIELIMLLYVRSIREGNFQLYLESLAKIVPWMFALDHTHYARWLPVHIRDMSSLAERHPAILAEFCVGKFVVHKTQNKFSAMAIDQCHEQNNAMVKESAGGAIGLMTNPGALRRWMVAGPEVARMVTEFESLQPHDQRSRKDHRHHDQNPGIQTKFLKEVKSLVSVMEEMGNPFLEESDDLIVLDSRDILDTCAKEEICNAEKLGEDQYQRFVEDRFLKCEKPITDIIPKNKLPLFTHTHSKRPSKQKLKVASLKSDCNLFSRLYISCQSRVGDLDTFFAHENQAAPPSLSQAGNLRSGKKSDLLECLELHEQQSINAPVVDAKFLDGAAVVQMLNTGMAKTFQEYADMVFLPYVSDQLATTNRVDIVWDTYITDSLKETTRQKRGKGIRRQVTPTTRLPHNWKDFLHVDENKTQLFKYLSLQVMSLSPTKGKVIYATIGEDVLSTDTDADVENLAPCSQEEADTRLLLHAADAVQKGCSNICIRTVDTDVVVLAIAKFAQVNPNKLWLAFGSKTNFRYIPIHEIVLTLSPSICKTLPVFHAFTGCDTTSSFAGRGKKTAWNTWRVFPDVTQAFQCLLLMEDDINQSTMSLLERFVVLIYNRTSDLVSVNDARRWLFTQKARLLENIPPTQAALKQHIKRTCYQAYCWNEALTLHPNLPSPADWGWYKDTNCNSWQPLWTNLPDAAESCHELVRCSCKKSCNARCKCVLLCAFVVVTVNFYVMQFVLFSIIQ